MLAPLLLSCLLPARAAEVQADLHLDTPTQLYRRGVGLDAADLEAGLAQLRKGGTNLAVMVLWPPKASGAGAVVQALLAKLEAEDARLDAVALARTPSDARRIASEGRVALLYAMEGAHGLDAAGVAGLAPLHARGLSLIGLTWSFSNRYAGSSGDEGGGLSADGRALIAEANRLGVLVDVSHASRASTLETCGASKAPVVASHSDAAGVTANKRNLSDEEIRCIASSGGVIGLNFHAPFVGSGANVSRIADHAEYLKSVGGASVVALGSDFDGYIVAPAGLPDAAGIPALWEELRRRGWTEAELRGVRGENFLRAWERAQAAAAGGAGQAAVR
jgi:membrane dipeptidase